MSKIHTDLGVDVDLNDTYVWITDEERSVEAEGGASLAHCKAVIDRFSGLLQRTVKVSTLLQAFKGNNP